MRHLSYILLFILICVSTLGIGQTNRYCLYDQVAIEKYQEDHLEDAISYIDSAIALCPSISEDPYSYKVQAQILKAHFKKTGKPNSRERSIKAYAKLKSYDTANIHTIHTNINLRFLAETYKKEAIDNLDTINCNIAFHKFMTYSNVMEDNIEKYEKEKDLVFFYGIYAGLHNDLYKNDNSRNINLDSSIYYFETALKIDSMNFDANNNLGIIYHNYALDLVFNQPENIEILELMVLQDEIIEYCLKSIPYLKKVNPIKPESMEEQKEILNSKIQACKGEFEQVDDILVIGVRIV